MEQLPDAEVIVVDNNSKIPIRELPVDGLARITGLRIVREDRQGLTPARLRGIEESRGGLLVFIDDDNFISPDFFAKGVSISERHPFVGAYSGQVRLVFDAPPPEWTIPYHGLLVRRLFQKDVWSNIPHLDETMPCGAGLFLRRETAEHYLFLHRSGRRGVQLDRSAASLLSGGDNDLAACACDIGLGVGLFHELNLDHHIPSSRLTRDYLLKLTKGIYASSILFKSFRGVFPEPYTTKRRALDKMRLLFMNPIQRAFFKAQLQGEDEGRKMLSGAMGV